MTVTLPWPPASLSPNARLHWASAARAKRAYREQCYWRAKVAFTRIDAESVAVKIEFHPPDRRRRDLDNCIASMKSGLDGIADAIGVDDSRWALTAVMGEPTKPGCVLVEVEPR